MVRATQKKTSGTQKSIVGDALRFEAAKLESLFLVLDAVAWMDTPNAKQVAQFAGLDPRTVGKLLKNAAQIGLVEGISSGYALKVPYPYRGSKIRKRQLYESLW